MSNQSTTLYLQVILLALQVQGLLEVLHSPRIEINIENKEQFNHNCYYNNNNKPSYLSEKLVNRSQQKSTDVFNLAKFIPKILFRKQIFVWIYHNNKIINKHKLTGMHWNKSCWVLNEFQTPYIETVTVGTESGTHPGVGRTGRVKMPRTAFVWGLRWRSTAKGSHCLDLRGFIYGNKHY